MMRHNRISQIVLGGILLLLTGTVGAQQEPQYTQFMFNKLPINAAYTGANEVLSMRALYRNQWTGIDGHPQNATFSIHSPLKNEDLAIGFNFVNDRLGEVNQNWFNVTYAYRIPLGVSGGTKLSFGVNAGVLYYKHCLTCLNANDPSDIALEGDVSKVMPDVGAGIYVYNPDKFYVGFSIPNFIRSELYNSEQPRLSNGLIAQRVPHMFAMVGGVIALGDAVKLRPQAMFKHILSGEYKSPFSTDFNLSFLLFDRVNIGATYRTTFGNREDKDKLTNADSFDANLEVFVTKQFMIGYAYDYTLTELKNFNGSGTHEIILGFDFSFDKSKIITPRYF